eukprot:5635015-Prymnesium_polylepis.1
MASLVREHRRLRDEIASERTRADHLQLVLDSARTLTSQPIVRGPTAESTEQRCQTMQQEHGVRPGVTWGSLSPSEQKTWRALNCDTRLPETDPTPQANRSTSAAR